MVIGVLAGRRDQRDDHDEVIAPRYTTHAAL
jgi:hypothetical protein